MFCAFRVGAGVEDCGTFWNVGEAAGALGARRGGGEEAGRTAVADTGGLPFLCALKRDGDAPAPLACAWYFNGGGGGGKGNIWNLLGSLIGLAASVQGKKGGSATEDTEDTERGLWGRRGKGCPC